MYTITYSSNKKPCKYVISVDHKFLEHENLDELIFNKIRFDGCSYFAHRKQKCHSKFYVILYEYILKNKIFKKLFNSEDANLPKGIIIYDCHKVCDNCLEKFKEEAKRCKLCPNFSDADYIAL